MTAFQAFACSEAVAGSPCRPRWCCGDGGGGGGASM